MGVRRDAEKVVAMRGRWVLLSSLAFACYSIEVCRIIARHQGVSVSAHSISDGFLQVVCWFVWGLSVTLWTFTTPGPFWSREQRAIMNDELVRQQRSVALRAAFFTLVALSMVQVSGVWWHLVPTWWPVAAVSAAMVVGAATFSVLDGRANG